MSSIRDDEEEFYEVSVTGFGYKGRAHSFRAVRNLSVVAILLALAAIVIEHA